VIGDVTQAAYLGPWLWKMTVEKAGSFDVDKVAAASPGIELKTAPEGYVKIHKNHHLWSKTRIGQGSPTAVQGDRRVAQADRAGSVPEGLPVSTAADPGEGARAGRRGHAAPGVQRMAATRGDRPTVMVDRRSG
jgi:hypothetical protein